MNEILAHFNEYRPFVQPSANALTELHEYILIWYSARIQTYLNRYLKEDERTLNMNVEPGGRIYSLPAYPISAVHSFTVVNNGTTLTENTDYYVHYDKGLIEFYTPPVSSYEPLTLGFTWTGGYTSTVLTGLTATVTFIQVPEDIRMATIMQSSYVFKKRDSLGTTGITTPDGSITSSLPVPDLLPEVKSILKHHRRWNSL